MIYGVVAVFGRPSRGSSSSLVRSRLNSQPKIQRSVLKVTPYTLLNIFHKFPLLLNKKCNNCAILNFFHIKKILWHDNFKWLINKELIDLRKNGASSSWWEQKLLNQPELYRCTRPLQAEGPLKIGSTEFFGFYNFAAMTWGYSLICQLLQEEKAKSSACRIRKSTASPPFFLIALPQ